MKDSVLVLGRQKQFNGEKQDVAISSSVKPHQVEMKMDSKPNLNKAGKGIDKVVVGQCVIMTRMTSSQQ